LDGHSLTRLSGPNTDDLKNGSLSSVAWSVDGQSLFAAGQYLDDDGNVPVLFWDQAAHGNRRAMSTCGAVYEPLLSPVPSPAGRRNKTEFRSKVGRTQSTRSSTASPLSLDSSTSREAWRFILTVTVSSSVPVTRFRRSTLKARPFGCARCLARCGRSTSRVTAGWSLPPTPTAQSVGIAWTMDVNS